MTRTSAAEAGPAISASASARHRAIDFNASAGVATMAQFVLPHKKLQHAIAVARREFFSGRSAVTCDRHGFVEVDIGDGLRREGAGYQRREAVAHAVVVSPHADQDARSLGLLDAPPDLPLVKGDHFRPEGSRIAAGHSPVAERKG